MHIFKGNLYLLIYDHIICLYIILFFSALSSEKYHLSSTLGPGDLRNVTDIGEATMSGKSGKHVRFKIQSEFTCDKNRPIDVFY